MKRVKPVYIGITAIAIIVVSIITAVLIHNRNQQELSRTDYTVVIEAAQGETEDTDPNLFIKKAGKGEPCNLRIITKYDDGVYI